MSLCTHPVLDVLGDTYAYRRALTSEPESVALHLNALNRLARTPNRAVRTHALAVLEDFLALAAPGQALALDTDALTPAVLSRVLAWIQRTVLVRGSAHLPSLLAHNAFVLCSTSSGSAATRQLVEEHLCVPVLRSCGDNISRRGDLVWISNIKGWVGCERTLLPQYITETQRLRAALDGYDPMRLFSVCQSVSRYVRVVNYRSEHRTLPDVVLAACEHLCARFHVYTTAGSTFATPCIRALGGVLDACCLLDLFSHQAVRVLVALTPAVEARGAREADLHNMVVDFLAQVYMSSGPVSCTHAWPRNFVAFCALATAILNAARRARPRSYLEFQRQIAVLANMQRIPRTLGVAVAGLAMQIIADARTAPCIDIPGLYIILHSLPRGLEHRSALRIVRSALRVAARQASTGTVLDCWYTCMLVQRALHLVSLRELGRRGARGALASCLNIVLAQFFAVRGPDLASLRIVYYVLFLLRDFAVARARRRFLDAAVWRRVCAHLARDPRLLGAGTAYSVVRCTFDITDALARDGADVLPDVPGEFLRVWFAELVVERDLPVAMYVAFLLRFARAHPRSRVVLHQAARLVQIAPHSMAEIEQVVELCERAQAEREAARRGRARLEAG